MVAQQPTGGYCMRRTSTFGWAGGSSARASRVVRSTSLRTCSNSARWCRWVEQEQPSAAAQSLAHRPFLEHSPCLHSHAWHADGGNVK